MTLVGVLTAALVHDVVALIVKMDDVGLKLKEGKGAGHVLGGLLAVTMPRLLATLPMIGIAVILWVDEHVLLDNVAKLGWGVLLGLVHGLVHATTSVLMTGETLEWVAETAYFAVLGPAVGVVAAVVVHLVPKWVVEPVRWAQAMGEGFGGRAAARGDNLEWTVGVCRVAIVVCSVVPLDGHPMTVELGPGVSILARCLYDVLGPTTLPDASPAVVEVVSKALISEGPGGWSTTVANLSEGILGGPCELALA